MSYNLILLANSVHIRPQLLIFKDVIEVNNTILKLLKGASNSFYIDDNAMHPLSLHKDMGFRLFNHFEMRRGY